MTSPESRRHWHRRAPKEPLAVAALLGEALRLLVLRVPCATTHHLCTAHPPSSAVCAWQRKLEEMGLVGVAQIVKMRRAQVDELIELLRPLPGHRLRLLNLFEEQRAYATPHTRTPG